MIENHPYDAIVSLGKGIKKGILTEYSKRSAELAVHLYEIGYADKILFAGGLGRWDGFGDVPEAKAMKKYAIELGVPEEAIHTEYKSKDTIQNAKFTKKKLKEMGVKRPLIGGVDFHKKRISYIFNRVLGNGFEPSYIGIEAAQTKEEYKNKWKSLVREKTSSALAKISPRIHLLE